MLPQSLLRLLTQQGDIIRLPDVSASPTAAYSLAQPRLDVPLSVQTDCCPTTNNIMLSSKGPDNHDPLLYRIPNLPYGLQQYSAPSLSPAEQHGKAANISINGYCLPAIAVAGEPRVPLNLAIQRSMRHLAKEEIDYHMEDLSVFNHLATPKHLELLRELDEEFAEQMKGMSQVNLVSRTDVERILAANRSESQVHRLDAIKLDITERLPICHMLFGRVAGWVYPSRKGGRSIQCQECQSWFIPEEFVLHTHSENKENQRVVHWGFDSANWRMMLFVDDEMDLDDMEQAQAKWEKFIGDEVAEVPVAVKRSVPDTSSKEVPQKIPASSEELLYDVAGNNVADLIFNPVPAVEEDDSLKVQLQKKHMRYEQMVMSEANNGGLPGLDPSKPSTSANQVLATQPRILSPSHFPPTLEQSAHSNTGEMMETITELEATLPPENARGHQLVERLRTTAVREYSEGRQREINYQQLLESYRLLTYLWRLVNNPDTPIQNTNQIKTEQGSIMQPSSSNVIYYPATTMQSQMLATPLTDPLLIQQLASRAASFAQLQQQQQDVLQRAQLQDLLSRARSFDAPALLQPASHHVAGLPVQLSPQQLAMLAQALSFSGMRPPQPPS